MESSTLLSSSNKVTVECTDPFNLFAQVKPHIEDHLPLRNLHWKSPSRPLRSIDTLNVTLTLDKDAAAEQSRPATSSDNASITSGGGANNSSSTTTITTTLAPSSRRHQIPGLRETPYLKLLLVRCDDNESYKSTIRKQVREWLKSNALSDPKTSSTSNTSSAANRSGGGGEKNHDAHEWLIVHVVVPDTPAAAQPRFARTNSGLDTSGGSGGGEGRSASSSSVSVWPSRPSSTVLERLKADFNASGKSAVDRVAQIRLPKPGSNGAKAVVAGLSPADVEAAWEDLVSKFKSLILTSFDLRVGQYEEDIKEKDSQRNLPGWNFCTFFILKEGLARGFANVGLFEDALIGYDELALGLDTIIREQAVGGDGAGAAGTFFLGYSQDLQERAVKALKEDETKKKKSDAEDDEEDVSLNLDPRIFPLDAERKPYRDLILANNISVFDFRSYVFARQMILLLRSGNASSLRDPTKENEKSKKSENLLTLADICRLTTEFITTGARTLRADLETGLDEVKDKVENVDEAKKQVVIDNMVHSWTYCVTLQVLGFTSTKALPLPDISARDAPTPEVSAAAAKLEEARAKLVKKNSSLLKSPPVKARPTSAELFLSGDSGPYSTSGQDKAASAVSLASVPGAEDLASWRAELWLLARRVLQGLGKTRGWPLDWTSLGLLYEEANVDEAEFEELSLDDDDSSESSKETTTSEEKGDIQKIANITTAGVEPHSLARAASSKKDFDALYEALTDQAFRHYTAASRNKSAERAMADLAVLKYRSGDYESAAMHFHRIAPFYKGTFWGALEGTMLELYAHCLKQMQKREEYVQVLLKLLAKFAADKRTFAETRRALPLVRSYIKDVFDMTTSLGKEISVPIREFFGGLEVEPMVHHYDDRDGFRLRLALKFLLDDEFGLDAVRVRLKGSEESQGLMVWLESAGDGKPVVVRGSTSQVFVDTNTTMYGWYTVDRIELKKGKITFVQDYATQSQQTTMPGLTDGQPQLEQGVQIFCYPAAKAFDGKILAPRHIDLTISRTVEIEIKSGWNHVRKGTLRIRPATAGLRLRLTEVVIMDGALEIKRDQGTGNIEFADFAPDSAARLRIPYSVENDPSMLSARLEVFYETEHGTFSYHSATSMNCTLPISVNVSDMFFEESLFSKFSISPATMTPLRMLGCEVRESDLYSIEPSLPADAVMDIFPKQPASILYKFTQKKAIDSKAPNGGKHDPLKLTIDFAALDEEALSAIELAFIRDVQGTPVSGLVRFLLPYLLEAFKNDWSAGKLEILGLLREIEMITYEAVGWDGIIGGLQSSQQDAVRTWLKEWHSKNVAIPLVEADGVPTVSASIIRQIVIPVDIPSVNIVHTAEIRLLDTLSDTSHVAVGQVIPAELHLSHTRRWYNAAKDETNPMSSINPYPDLEFSFEILANPEVWLIGGNRRGNFTSPASEVTDANENDSCSRVFPIILMPQRPGHLLLPGIDIKTFIPLPAHPQRRSSLHSPVTQSQPGNTISSVPPRRQIPCEVDYKSLAKAVLVLPDLRRTTVSLDVVGGASGTGGAVSGPGGAWLVDSERGIGI